MESITNSLSSEPSSPVQDNENESTKPKRLPRSAKKRLRYERIRQQQKQAPKKKKTSSTHSSSIVIPSNSSESNFICWKFLSLTTIFNSSSNWEILQTCSERTFSRN